MKKRVLGVVLTLVLALGCVFAVMGCGSDAKDLYDYAKSTSTPYSSATKIEELEGYSKFSSSGSLVVLNKIDSGNTNYKVFNLDKGAVVATIAVPNTAVGGVYVSDIVSVGKSVIFSTYKASGAKETTYKLYDANGTEAASVSKATYPSTAQNLDLIEFNDVIYRVGTDGSVVKAFDVNDLSKFDITKLDAKSENYYYDYSHEEGQDNNKITVLNDYITVYSAVDGTPVSYYQKPSYATDVKYFILSNGNIFVQYAVREDSYTDKYDYLDGTNKYTIEQKIVNPKNGDVKDVKNSKNPVYIKDVDALSGVIDEDYTFTTDEYKGSAKNFASVQKIEDKKINTSTDYNYFMSDKGKLSEIEDTVVAQKGKGKVLDNGYVIFTNKLGQEFLYDAKLKLVGDISGATAYTNKFILTEKAVYDYNLNKIVDIGGDNGFDYYIVNEEVVTVGENIVLQKKNADDVTEYFVLKDGNPVLIAKDSEIESFSTSGKCIYVTKSGKYYIYNEEGTVLLSDLGSSSTFVANSGDKMLRQVGSSFYYFK